MGKSRHAPAGRRSGGGSVGVGMLRGVRRPRPPGRSHACAGDEVDELLDELDAIELSPSDPGYRSKVLASVGLGDDDSDEGDKDEIESHRCDRRKSGRRRNNKIRENNDAEDGANSADEDDDQFGDDASEYESFSTTLEHENTWRATICRVVVKLLWISVAVAAVVYVLYDGERLEESEIDEDVVPKKEPYSYHGYTDGRIPDDDTAQFGGGIVGGEVFGASQDAEHEEDEDDEDEQLQNEKEQQSVEHHVSHKSTGVVEVDALWQQLEGYAEMSDPYDAQRELPVFWHIPKCGGTTLQDLMVHCIGMVGANEIGAANAKDTGTLEVAQLENGNRYATVDMSTPEGIAHAKDLGFGQSGVADVVMTPWFDAAASVFDDDDHKGRCFTMLRHPIRRAISMFWYLKDATWEHTYSEAFKNMTVEEYATSQYAEDNWMVRFLTNQMTGGVYERHLDLAKEILESKCLVGVLEEFKPSFKRFSDYFGWGTRDFGGPVTMNNRGPCIMRVMGHPDNTHSHPKYDEGGEVWNLLMEKNRYDAALYEHALRLFHEVQSELVDRR